MDDKEDLTPIKELDFILKFLATNVRAKPGISLDNLYKEIKVIKPELYQPAIVDDWGSRLRRILDKLEKDGLVKIGYHEYEITFDGYVKNLKDGYEGEIKDRNAENIRVGKLENRQKRYELNQTLLLTLVALGTLIAAWYYLIEIWKHYHPHYF